MEEPQDRDSAPTPRRAGIASPTPVSFDHLVGARKALGLEGIVSKRLDKPYSSGRCEGKEPGL